MLDIPSISAIVAAIGVIIGVVITVLELRNLLKQRQADLIMRLHSQACTKEFVEAYQKVANTQFNDYNDFIDKYGSLYAEGPQQTAIIMCAMFMEGIGVLLHKKLADIEAIQELFPVETAWKKLEPVLVGTRKQYGTPGTYEWFEYLYNEVKKRQQQTTKKQTNATPS